jgi:hypothetical protein
MTAAAIAPPAATAPLTTNLITFLRLLGGGQHIRLFSWLGARNPTAKINAGAILHTLPAQMLVGLERHDVLRLELGAYASPQAADPTAINMLLAQWPLPRVYRNPKDPAKATGKDWIFDTLKAQAVLDRLESFPLAPTAIIVGGEALRGAGYELSALWAVPGIDVRGDGRHDAALDLLRRLAAKLGADELKPPMSLDCLSVAVPGSAIDEGSEWRPAQFISFNPERCYSLASIQKEIL